MACEKRRQIMLNSRKENDILIIHPDIQRLDASVAVSFKAKMADFINGGNKSIILNLSGIEFIDSSGLGSIVSSLKLIGKNGDLLLCGINRNVMSMFKLTRMDRVFQIFSSEYEAISSLSK
jgi:anti-sigma B factor antagonist